MKHLLITLGLLFLAACSGSKELRNSTWTDSDDAPSGAHHMNEDGEIVLAASDIPPHIKAAAIAAVPGLAIELAEEEGNGVYCVHGSANGHAYEVEVDSKGKVLEVEMDDDDDEHGDDDDDDDDDHDEDEDEDDDK